ncbi:16S rRNA processing protein RimM [Paludibacter sp. 221]|uniref:ribosome maturation factor RimM n=1 Tax=Paludibacter sp. 221 TaxID=2302939 RepID=UPI0013D3EB63|nr:ribosome maturation factor RimM [Paludibacter sp. 221]NDV47094.1 16S rRNA processing protein RimM [Paludibacter sp. 221]
MINKEDVFPVGKINKPHGINGEMSFTFTTDVFDTENAEFFIFEMDGILVPFYIDSYRFKTDTTALLKLQDVDSEEQAREFNGQTVYLPMSFREKVEEDELTMEYFVGFGIMDEKGNELGRITAIDDSTENVLFVLNSDSEELLIPANDDFIEEIDHNKKTIKMNIPEGLLDL